MSYTLKASGLATEASSIIAVDDDGTTIRDFVDSSRTSAFTINAAVTTGTSTWKGTSRSYFQTLPNGDYAFKGITIDSGHKIPFNAAPGHAVSFFIASAGAEGPHGSGSLLAASTGGIVKVVSGTIAFGWGGGGSGTTTLPTNSSTKFSMGGDFTYGGARSFFYGLESGSLAADGTGTDGGYGNDAPFTQIGGETGQGNSAGKRHLIAIFPRALTLAEMQSLHNDWFGTLFDAGDTTAPTLTSPTGTATSSTTASGTVSTNEANGTLYAVCTTSGTAPTYTQVQAGQDNSGTTAAFATTPATVTATGSQSVAATGLTASTAYYWHYQHKDAAGNNSTVVSSASFTTTSGSSPPLFRTALGGLSGLGSSGPFFQNPLQ